MKRKLLPLLFITGGLLFLLIGLSEMRDSASAQKDALEEVKTKMQEQHPVPSAADVDEAEPAPFQAAVGESMGILSIPRLNAELPIIHGISEDELQKGVGHYPGTAFPGKNDQVVLAGHRDTVFRDLGQLEIGDILIIDLPYGKFEYVMTETEIVDADDRTVIVPTAPDEVLTLITCYPFSFVGNAPQRYIIYAIPR